MARLTVECLEGRTLMSAVPVTGFTPPIGSNKGSVVGSPTPVALAGDGCGAVPAPPAVSGRAEAWVGVGATA